MGISKKPENRMAGGNIVFPFVVLSVDAADFRQGIVYAANITAYPDYEDPLIKERG